MVLTALVLLGAAVAYAPVISAMMRIPEESPGGRKLLVGGWSALVLLVTVFGVLNVNDMG